MILIIDNYDSFTFNLAQYFQQLGQSVQVVKNDQITLAELASHTFTHLVISPGPCTPNESGISMQAIAAYAGKVPILGVCLGHQAIAQQFSQQVVRAKKVMHGKTSQIHHSGTGLFNDLPNPLMVVRYHSLLVSQAPEEFEVTAYVEEYGEQLIMAMAHKTLPIHSVQFHPESILTECGLEMLANFLTIKA